jgi:Na+/melibiose symporter-like transporter
VLRGRHRADGTALGRRFTVLWAGQAVSQLGNYLAFISIPLFVKFLTTDAAFPLGVANALETAPTLLVGLLGGAAIDRLRIRGVMIGSDLVRAAAFAGLAIIGATDPAPGSGNGLTAVFLVALVVGTFTTLFEGALFTILPSLVHDRDLARANGRLAATQNLAFAIGPALAGVVISLSETYWVVFALDAATFLFSAVSVVLIGPVSRPSDAAGHGRLLAEVAQGLRYVWEEIRIRTSTIALAVANLVVGFIEATLVLAADDVVGATEEWQQGIVFAVLGAGAVVGAALAPGLTRIIGLGRTMIAGLLVFGAGYTIFVNSPFGIPGLIYLFIGFMGIQFVNVSVATIRQTYTPNVLLGRVMTASRAIGWTTLPLGALVGTAIADATGRFELLTRITPLLLLAVGTALLFTPIWSDAFGPFGGRRAARPRSARKRIEL